MPSHDDERKQRLSILCKRLRGKESLRSFTAKRKKELGGISYAAWGVWERAQGDLSDNSLARLVNFLDCSYEYFYGYLDGFVTLEELLKPSPNGSKPSKEQDFSPEVAAAWVKSLAPQDKLFVATQGLQAFQEEFNKLLEAKAKEKIELLLNFLSSSSYPESSQIEATAKKLDISMEDLKKLCDRLYLNKSKKEHEHGPSTR